MAQIKVRSFVKVSPTITKSGSGISASYAATLKGINRMGGAVESLGKNLETVDKLFKFRNEFLIQSQAKRIKLEDRLSAADAAEEKLSEQKQKRWWKRFLDQKAEDASEKAVNDPDKVIDKKADIIKKALTPLERFFKVFSGILEPIMRMFVLMPILNWITGQDTGKLAKTIGNIVTVVGFVRKLVGFGVGTLLDGLSNLFGGFDRIKHGNVAGVLQGFVGALQLVSGVALVKAAQYIFMPWKLIGDVKWVTNLFTEWGKISGEAEGAAKNKDIAGYVDRNGNTISKEDFEKAKSKARKNDERVAKRNGKGWSYSGSQDYLGDRYRAQYGGRKKGFLARNTQRGRIAFKRGTRGIRGQFKMAGNWMAANPAKGNAIFSVIGGVTRAAGGLMSGEGGTAVGAGVGQAAGGIAGFALGNMLLPGIGGIIGSALGSFLGEWVGTKLGPMIDPIIKPIGNAFKLGFDIISPAVGFIAGEAGEMFSALFDGLGALFQLAGTIASVGMDILKFAWESSLIKKAIDGLVWIWQHKDNIGGAVRDVLVTGAKGLADSLTFNVFDFDRQNKKAIGGPVPLMAAGGIVGTDSPEVMGLKYAGSAIIATTSSTLDRLGIVGNIVKAAIAPQVSFYGNLFGVNKVAVSGDRMQSQINKPAADLNVGSRSAPGQDNSAARKLIGEGQVTLLTAQPNGAFTPQNQKTTRGLLADIYNAFASARFGGGGGGGNGIGPNGPGGSGPDGTGVGGAGTVTSGSEGVARVVVDEARQLGWNEYALASLAGDLGRENGWNRNTIMKGHSDPANNAVNVGIISWQGSRRTKLLRFLQQQGQYDGKTMKTDDKTLRLMVRFMDDEMKSYGVWDDMRNAKSTFAASEALRKYIVYDPNPPYNSYDSQFRVKNNATWANIAKQKGIVKFALGGKFELTGVPEWYDAKESKNARRTKRAKGAKKFAVGGLLSLGGSSAPGGDRKMTGNSTFSDTHLHHNEPDGSPHNRALMGYGFGPPRDYVLTRGPQSMDRGTPIVAGASGKVKVIGGSMNIVELYDPSGRKLARFLHNDKILVKDGQTVGPNTIIATQGSAGGNWPVHVHLEGSSAFQTNWIRASLGNKNLADIQGGDTMVSPSDTASAGGKSLLEGGGEPSDPFKGAQLDLEKALNLWAEAFGGATASTSQAVTPKTTPSVSASPTATSTGSTVQTGSEQHVSREATKPGTAAVVPVPIIASAGGQQSMPTFVKNSALPKATVN